MYSVNVIAAVNTHTQKQAGSRFIRTINYSPVEKCSHPKTSHVVQFAAEMFINCLVDVEAAARLLRPLVGAQSVARRG